MPNFSQHRLEFLTTLIDLISFDSCYFSLSLFTKRSEILTFLRILSTFYWSEMLTLLLKCINEKNAVSRCCKIKPVLILGYMILNFDLMCHSLAHRNVHMELGGVYIPDKKNYVLTSVRTWLRSTKEAKTLLHRRKSW